MFTLVSSADFPNLEVATLMKHTITLGKLLWVFPLSETFGIM